MNMPYMNGESLGKMMEVVVVVMAAFARRAGC